MWWAARRPTATDSSDPDRTTCLIRPGDWLHGDRDGMVCIPAERLDEVTEKSLAAMTAESRVRRAILDGMDPQQAYLTDGKF